MAITPANINDHIRDLLRNPDKLRHPEAECKETNGWYQSSSVRRGGYWLLQFTCPVCGRDGKFHRNYLGQRKIFCDGLKFERRLS